MSFNIKLTPEALALAAIALAVHQAYGTITGLMMSDVAGRRAPHPTLRP